MPSGLAEAIAEMQARHQAKEAQRVAQQGLGRPIISAEFAGGQVVAVRNKVYHIKGKTFHDFLGAYLQRILDPDWGNAELKKPLADRHPILQWYDSMCRLQRRAGLDGTRVQEAEANGAAAAWLRLAYDLYALDHNAELQKKLIGRLKNLDMFPGARYEIYVAAAMIRAGFDIEFEDEDDRGTSHCEFVATYRKNGNKYSVEAKHRNRGDATGALKFRLGKRLQKALRKHAAHPRIVFLDVGAPDEQKDNTMPDFMRHALQDLRRFEGRSLHGEPLPPAYVFLTNTPADQDLEGEVRRTVVVAEGFQIPEFKMDTPFQSLRQAYAALLRHQDIHNLIDSIRDHGEVPATFDGESPELAFGEHQGRLTVGSWYEIPINEAGDLAQAKLLQGVVMEADRIATCIYQLEDGKQIIASTPLSDAELRAYARHPTTFFGQLDPSAGRTITDPLEMFMWLLDTHKVLSRAQLLERLSGWEMGIDIKDLPTQDLLELYVEGMTHSLWKDQASAKPTGT